MVNCLLFINFFAYMFVKIKSGYHTFEIIFVVENVIELLIDKKMLLNRSVCDLSKIMRY